MEVKGPVRLEAAQVWDGADRCVGLRKERGGGFETDAEDFIKDAVSPRLAETALEVSPRVGEAFEKLLHGEAGARLASDDFDRFGDKLLMPSVAAGRFAADDKERVDEDGACLRRRPPMPQDAAWDLLPQRPCGEEARAFEVELDRGNGRLCGLAQFLKVVHRNECEAPRDVADGGMGGASHLHGDLVAHGENRAMFRKLREPWGETRDKTLPCAIPRTTPRGKR